MSNFPNGSLIFVEHSNHIVENETGSPITHVGMIIHSSVYEAIRPQVRKISLSNFNKHNHKFNIYISKPLDKFNDNEVIRMISYLDGQIKRRYSIFGYVLNHSVNGIHCGELVANALNKTGRYHFVSPWKMVPGTLFKVSGFSTPRLLND